MSVDRADANKLAEDRKEVMDFEVQGGLLAMRVPDATVILHLIEAGLELAKA